MTNPETYFTKCYCSNCKGTPDVVIPFGTDIDSYDYSKTQCEICGNYNCDSITEKPTDDEI